MKVSSTTQFSGTELFKFKAKWGPGRADWNNDVTTTATISNRFDNF
jgi:hypothetical protein